MLTFKKLLTLVLYVLAALVLGSSLLSLWNSRGPRFTFYFTGTVALATAIAWIFSRWKYKEQRRSFDDYLTESERRKLNDLLQIFALKCFIFIYIPFMFFTDLVLYRHFVESSLILVLGMAGALVLVLILAYRMSHPIREFYDKMCKKYSEKGKEIAETSML